MSAPGTPEPAMRTEAPTPTPAAAGTLSIGSLKGQPQMTALPTADKPGHEPLA